MKRLLLIIILTLSFQTLTKADDISDFEIEGMSIGDSALDFFNENEINRNYFPKSNKYYYSWFSIDNSDKYSEIQAIMKDNDKNYTIQSIRAGKKFDNKIDKCLEEKKILVKEFEEIIGASVQLDNIPKYPHSNSYPNSFIYSTQFEFKNNDLIRIYCTDWSLKVQNKTTWKDNLSISILKAEYRICLNEEAY